MRKIEKFLIKFPPESILKSIVKVGLSGGGTMEEKLYATLIEIIQLLEIENLRVSRTREGLKYFPTLGVEGFKRR